MMRNKFFYLCLFLFTICIALGIWQLHRYQLKKDWLTAYQKNMHKAPQSWQDFIATPSLPPFQVITVTGELQPAKEILLQNRFYQGQLGYEVLSPLRVAGEKKLLLIDRGWVKKPAGAGLPSFPPIKGNKEWVGYIKKLGEYQFILGKNILQAEQIPLVMQRLDLAELSRITLEEYFPFILRLNAAAPYAFPREWTVTAVTPLRHLGYAVQWFVFALICLIGYWVAARNLSS